MLLEIDQIAVDAELLKRVRAGDKEALKKVRTDLSGITLYMHNLSWRLGDAVELISLREAHELGLVDAVVISDM